MVKYKVSVSNDCIGCGACVSACPESFAMKGSKSSPKKPIVEKLGCIKEAADGCPVDAIKVEETK